MKPHTEASVPFEITATNLNLADYVNQTICTFPASDLVHVPSGLRLFKAAGTAYTLTTNATTEENRAAEKFPHAPPHASYSDMFGGGKFMYIIDSIGVVYFKIPLTGFLDVATAQRRISFASRSGGTFNVGATGLYLRMGCGVSAGTGSLTGTLYYEDYATLAV
jgi:hypothetical protein